MKTKFTALALAAVTALSLAPKPAMAGDKEVAIIGGFLGGLIVASAINDSHHDGYYERGHTAVVVNDYECRDQQRDSGCWKEVSVQVWVPACWIVERSYYGRDCRRYVGGHYEYRTNRVWVAFDRNDRHENREISRCYGHDRR